jgi:hypothetical protein
VNQPFRRKEKYGIEEITRSQWKLRRDCRRTYWEGEFLARGVVLASEGVRKQGNETGKEMKTSNKERGSGILKRSKKAQAFSPPKKKTLLESGGLFLGNGNAASQ